jgi:hypothetical protein
VDAKPLSPPQFATVTLTPCTYHGKQFGVFVNSFSETQFPLLRLVTFLPCSAVSKSPRYNSFLFWAPLGRASNSELLADPTSRRVPPRRRISPLPYQIPADFSYVSLHSVSLLVVYVSFPPPVTLKSATIRNLLTAPIRYILT